MGWRRPFYSLAVFFFLALFVVSAVSLVFASTSNDSLLGYWKLDDSSATSAVDSSGNGRDGTPNGTTVTTDKPSMNFPDSNARSFNGTSDYISVANTSTLLANQSAMSISVWVKTAGQSSHQRFIAGWRNDSNASFYILHLVNSDNLELRATTDSGSTDLNPSFAGHYGTWTNIVFVRDGTALRGYINGSLVASSTISGAFQNSNNFFIGQDPITSNAFYYDGSIDDVRVYDRALSNTEISDLASGKQTSATWTGSTSTDYEVGSNWDIGSVPDPYTNIIIANTTNIASLSANEAIGGLTINSSGLLNTSGFNLTMNDSGTFSNSGTLMLTNGETLSGLTNDTSHGTVLYTNTANKTGFNLGNAFNNLILSDGLVGYWRLDEATTGETVIDSSGYRNNGTSSGTSVTTIVPTVNFVDPRARNFDGSASKINAGDNESLDITGPMTISAWIYPRSFSGGSRGRIFDRDANNHGYEFAVDNNSGTSALHLGINSTTTLGTNFVRSNNNVITLNQWQHVAVTWTGNAGGTATFYVNGVAAGGGTMSQAIVGDSTLNGIVGGRDADDARDFNGYLDDVRIYNRVLSPTEIARLGAGNEPATSRATTTLNNALTVNGNLVLNAGTLDTSGSSYGLTVGGNFENNGGVFTPRSGTVTLNGSNQLINSSNTFYNLTKSVSSSDTLMFAKGSTTTITNTLTLAGADGNLLALRSSEDGIQFKIDPQGTRTLSYLNPQDSNNTNATAIAADNTFSYGTNLTNWDTPTPTPTSTPTPTPTLTPTPTPSATPTPIPTPMLDPNTPYFIIGDGSGGGGAGGGSGAVGGNGGGGDDTINLTNSHANNVVFGDGSGGGAGGRGVGYVPDVRGGVGGSGNDTLTGGSGNDVIFGDGFNGLDATQTAFYPGRGGLGGGGGGAVGGGFGGPPQGAAGGICGGGGGGGTVSGTTQDLLVSCTGATKGSSATGSLGGNGGNSGISTANIQGLGSSRNLANGGGGGGFGGTAGGTGSTIPGNGDTNQHWYEDGSDTLYNYFTLPVLQSVLTDYPNYGNGKDTIDGKGGANELYGLGGDNTFVIDSSDHATRDRIWDFRGGDKLLLKTDGVTVASVDVNTIVSGATTGDYGSGISNHDTQFYFDGTEIDLIGITYDLTSDATGQIVAPNNPPTVSLADTPLSYTPNDPAVAIDTTAAVSDPDGDSDWNGGSITVQITSNAVNADTLSFPDNGVASASGTIIKYNGNNVGAFSAADGTVTGSTVLTMTFDSGATNAIVQDVLRNVSFSTTDAGASDRIVTVTATDNGGKSAQDYRVISVTGAGSVTLYTVTTNAGTGGSMSPTSRDVLSGDTAEFTVTTDPGYTLDSISGCGGSLNDTTYTTGTITADCAISASFTSNMYTISFDTQGGASVGSITKAYNASVTIPTTTRSGYTFSGWNTAQNGSLTTFQAGSNTTMPYNGMTLYAQWSPITSSSTNSSPTTTTSGSSCNAFVPTGIVNLYQLDPSLHTMTLFFTPMSGSDGYAISYGTNTDANQFGVTFSNSERSGAIAYTIQDLAQGTPYYFKVKPLNGCASGEWSNTLSATTTGNTSSGFISNTIQQIKKAVTPEKKITVTKSSTTASGENNLSCTYTVKSGDSFWSIAKSQLGDGSKYQTLQTLNTSHSGLHPGEVLQLPCNNSTSKTNTTQLANVSLSVKVVDNNNTPLAGVRVTLHSRVQTAVTNGKGIATFEQVESGNHEVLLAYNGYTGLQKLTVKGQQKQQTLTLQVQLTQGIALWIILVGVSVIGVLVLVIVYLLFLLRKKRVYTEKASKL